jgi:ElaB/YqjD/DUF883 family membrane-anchored ribosome-binding protein
MNSTKALNALVNDVEELLAELSEAPGPVADEMRKRVEETIDSAKRAIKSRGQSTSARLTRYAGNVDRYVTTYPRLGFLTGIFLGGMVVYLAGSRPLRN